MDDRASHDGKICIICHKLDRFGNEHGEFWMTPGNFLHGQRCPKCANEERSSNKLLIKYSHKGSASNTGIIPKSVLDIDNFVRSIVKSGLIVNTFRPDGFGGGGIDMFILNSNLEIDYIDLNGHSEMMMDRNDMLNKLNELHKNGIRLFNVFEDEWIDKQDIVKSMLKNILGITDNRIYARKCTVKEVDYQTANDFLNSNHLQGQCPSKIRLGLFYNDELVSIMTFGKSRHFIGSGKYQWELLRFCNKLNTSVIGGASKLFKYFIDKYQPKNIVSYADRRWSEGNLYYKLGFALKNYSKPNYYYVIGDKRMYRFEFRKSVLVEKYDCPIDMSEKEFCFSQHWYRIYDCGAMAFIWESGK